MEVISDTIDENGKRHLVVRYTEEEKSKMEEKRKEMEKKRQEIEEKMKKFKKPVKN